MNIRQTFIVCLSIVTIFFLMTRCEEHSVDHGWYFDVGLLEMKKFEPKPTPTTLPLPTAQSTPVASMTPNPNVIPPQ